MSSEVPLLLVDVDGVLSLFGFDAASPLPGRIALIDGAPHRISERAGPVLRRLLSHFDPVWCTGWEERAGERLPHLLGLPSGWPHIRFEPGIGQRPGTSLAGHWKLAAIDAFAGADRPLAWIDDHLDGTCTAWASARTGPTLLVRTDSTIGLTEEHEVELTGWATGLTVPPPGSG